MGDSTGVTQPKVSALRHYKPAGFSGEVLMNLLNALDQDIEIVIRRKPRSRKAGRISVVAALSRFTQEQGVGAAEGYNRASVMSQSRPA
jgi:hypothetical protein